MESFNGPTERSGEINTKLGTVNFRVEFADRAGDYTLKFWWPGNNRVLPRYDNESGFSREEIQNNEQVLEIFEKFIEEEEKEKREAMKREEEKAKSVGNPEIIQALKKSEKSDLKIPPVTPNF